MKNYIYIYIYIYICVYTLLIIYCAIVLRKIAYDYITHLQISHITQYTTTYIAYGGCEYIVPDNSVARLPKNAYITAYITRLHAHTHAWSLVDAGYRPSAPLIGISRSTYSLRPLSSSTGAGERAPGWPITMAAMIETYGRVVAAITDYRTLTPLLTNAVNGPSPPRTRKPL